MIPLSRSLHFSVYIVHSINSGLEIFTAGRWLDHKRRQKKIRQRGKQGMASMVPMDKSKRQAESKGQSKLYHHLQFLLLASLLQVRSRLHHTAIHGLLSRLLQSFFSRSRVSWGNTHSSLTPALRTLSCQCAGHRRREVRAAVAGLSPASANRGLAEHDRQ
jgi:hypothetical protein